MTDNFEGQERWRTGKYRIVTIKKQGKGKDSTDEAPTCVGIESDQGREEEGTAATPMYNGRLNIKFDEYTTSTDISQHTNRKYEPHGTDKVVYGPEKHEIQGISVDHTLTCTEVEMKVP